MDLGDLARANGFVDEAEFHRMIASVRLTEPGDIERFEHWQLNDGSKEGLERLEVKKKDVAR